MYRLMFKLTALYLVTAITTLFVIVLTASTDNIISFFVTVDILINTFCLLLSFQFMEGYYRKMCFCCVHIRHCVENRLIQGDLRSNLSALASNTSAVNTEKAGGRE